MSRDPDRTYRWVTRAATAVVLLACLAIVLLVATACRDESTTPPPPTGTVETRVDTTLPDGRVRADLTVRYPDGTTGPAQLDGSTACVVGSAYPACAG